MKNILLVAVENSAENYAVGVVEAFNRKYPGVKFFGVGGDRLSACQMDITVPNRELAVVGIVEILAHLWKIGGIFRKLQRQVRERKADAALLIDYPDFNLRLARKLSQLDIPVYYYISPTVWAWRYSRVKWLRKYVRHLFIIFPFEQEICRKEKIPHTFVGHPLLSQVMFGVSPPEVRRSLGMASTEKLIVLLPGSRRSEIHSLLAVMLQAMADLSREVRLKLCILRADNIDQQELQEICRHSPIQANITNEKGKYDLLRAADLVVSTCGTSNLEIASCGTPFIAVYRVHPLSYFLGKPFLRIAQYSIVNILAGREVIPELIQSRLTAGNIAAEAKKVLQDIGRQQAMREEFQRIIRMFPKAHQAAEIISLQIMNDLNAAENSRDGCESL